MLKILLGLTVLNALLAARDVCGQQQFVPKDVDVFNKNYNRNQRNARNHLLRGFDVVPSNVSKLN